MQSQWNHVSQNGDESKLVFQMTLTGDVAIKRDHAIMEYMREISRNSKNGSVAMNPVGLTNLWDEAFIAGVDHKKPGDAEPAPKKAPRKAKRKTKKKA